MLKQYLLPLPGTQLTIFGEPDYILSRKEQFPSKNNSEDKDHFNLHLLDLAQRLSEETYHPELDKIVEFFEPISYLGLH
jgi:hypothetical protein